MLSRWFLKQRLRQLDRDRDVLEHPATYPVQNLSQ